MYRAVAWEALRRGLNLEDSQSLAELALGLDMRLEPDFALPSGCRLYLNGRDITEELHAPAIDRAVSKVAAVPAVRREMVRRQQEMARGGGVVMAGRDICSVVLPQAQLQYYLDASPSARAQRRWEELRAKGDPITLEEVLADLERRDYQDTHRQDSPLRKTERAEYIDCSRLDAQQVVDLISIKYRAWHEAERASADQERPQDHA